MKTTAHPYSLIFGNMLQAVIICNNDLLITYLNSHAVSGDDINADAKNLSLREIEVIKLIKQGYSSKEIATELNIAVRTAEVHRHNILKKLQLKNTAALINYINNSTVIL